MFRACKHFCCYKHLSDKYYNLNSLICRRCPICESGQPHDTFEVIFEGEYGNRNKTSTNRDNLGYYKRDTDEIKEMTEEYLNFVYQVCAADDKDKPPEDFQLFDVGEIYRSIHF